MLHFYYLLGYFLLFHFEGFIFIKIIASYYTYHIYFVSCHRKLFWAWFSQYSVIFGIYMSNFGRRAKLTLSLISHLFISLLLAIYRYRRASASKASAEGTFGSLPFTRLFHFYWFSRFDIIFSILNSNFPHWLHRLTRVIDFHAVSFWLIVITQLIYDNTT